ncbi:hypothetical protein E6_6 [Propionibacterium phage E6]|uniref:Uncharacterized protein n=1 Tax=Propionibacterium phage E6 TaxID=1897536 RepID=A0A1D8EU10_9CAUD|nr:hypothetical protein FDH11_gp06 [Propionibacterium phage E6]AOT24535.1 hypothetical protein E6_6 [Propionibacterium phage E6]
MTTPSALRRRLEWLLENRERLLRSHGESDFAEMLDGARHELDEAREQAGITA